MTRYDARRERFDWRKVPRQALIDALRNAGIGAYHSKLTKEELVREARWALSKMQPEDAEHLAQAIQTEIDYRLGRAKA